MQGPFLEKKKKTNKIKNTLKISLLQKNIKLLNAFL